MYKRETKRCREQNVNNVTIAITTSGCFCCAAMFGMVNDDDNNDEAADGMKKKNCTKPLLIEESGQAAFY